MCAKKLTDVFDVDFLQRFQDAFSGATGMASISTDLEGPVTEPSNFTYFCNVLTRGTAEGRRRCEKCDIQGGAESDRTGRPAVYYCHAGLMDFGAPIVINGEQVGSILGGQVLTAPPDEEKFRRIAQEIGADPDEYIEALRKVKIVPEEQIRQAAELLHISIGEVAKVQTQYMKLEQSHATVQEHVDYINEQVRLFSDSIGELSEDQVRLLTELTSLSAILDNINRIVKAVSTIAQKSKLLSFNGSVEAARTGLEGRGFGVIAQEMRTLADDTTDTLKQIETYTDEVMQATRQVMKIGDASNKSLELQTDRLESVFPRLDSIVEEIARLDVSGSQRKMAMSKVSAAQ